MNITEHAEPPSSIERSEEALSWVGIAVVATLRFAELFAIAVAAVFVAPPLVILVVVVAVPAIALTALVALVAGVIAAPVFLIRHVHRHRSAHAHHLVHRLAARPAWRVLRSGGG
jgi:hypothetical protein